MVYIMVLTCNFLMTSEVDHIFICLVAIYNSFCQVPIQVFCPGFFFFWVICLKLICRSSLYISDTISLLGVDATCPSEYVLFTLFIVSIHEQTFFTLI